MYKILTLKEIKNRTFAIEKCKQNLNLDVAKELTYSLYEDLLIAIADGACEDSPETCAKEVLNSTLMFKFRGI